MRNKAKGFPNRISLSDDRETTDAFNSKRPDGTIKDHPQERMFHANHENGRNENRD